MELNCIPYRSKAPAHLQSFGQKIFLNQRLIIAFKADLSIHLVDLREATLFRTPCNKFVELLFQLPDIALDKLDNSDATHASVRDGQVNRQHVVLGAFNEVGKFLVARWIRRRPTWRIFCLHKWLRNCVIAQQLLHVLPFRRISYHLNFRMLFNTFEFFRRAITRRPRWNYGNCSLKSNSSMKFNSHSTCLDLH